MSALTYKTITSLAHGLYKEKGSKFFAYAFPVETEQEIKQHLVRLKKEHYKAKHICYAYLLKPDKSVYRVKDDGEPPGTAGFPILGQIRSAELTNIVIFVVRYFGGSLLGIRGLIDAYRTAAADAIVKATLVFKNSQS